MKKKTMTFAEWVKANPPLDLQELVSKCGGYDFIPPEAWARHDQALADWNYDYRWWHKKS
jgi:hypothetical protein